MCRDFSDKWAGFRFFGAWNEVNAGGTPIKQTEEAKKLWATNPQYLMELKKETELFLSLGQPDGRLWPGAQHPYKDYIHNTMFTVMNLDEDESIVRLFDAKKVARDTSNKRVMSKIMEYREISLRAVLSPGRYMIVPSTKYSGDLGKYYLNIYFDQGEEIKPGSV